MIELRDGLHNGLKIFTEMLKNTAPNNPNQAKRSKRPDNRGAPTLNPVENEELFRTIGKNCVSLTAGICQLLKVESKKWTYVDCGIITLIKDYGSKSYSLRLYDLYSGQLLFQQILYQNFRLQYQEDRSNVLLVLETEKREFYGLLFSDQGECNNIYYHCERRYEQERKKYKSQVNIIESNTTQPNGVGIGITSLGAVSYNSIQHLEKKPKNMIKKSKKKDKKPKITKDDIGNPTNFQHRAHIGWNQNGGFNQNVCDEPMDDSVRALLTAAGENPDNMKPEEIKFAYQFIQNWENDPKSLITDLPTPPGAMVIERYPISSYEDLQKKPQISKPLPNLPASRVTQPNIPRHEMAPARPPPPPPPPGNRTASLATTSTPTHPPPPPPPPPPKFDSRMEQKLVTSAPPNAPPAPPPPPPTLKPESSKNAPPKPTGARANLLSEIHQGAKLRHVGAPVEKTGALVGKVANTSTGNARDDVMNAIRQGTSLRHVDQTEVEEQRKSVVENNMDGLAGALARALEKRRLNMNQSDSENADSGNEWDD